MKTKPEAKTQPNGARLRRCQQCGSSNVFRSHRQGLEYILSWIGLYPFRCEDCGCRFNGPAKWK